MAVTIDETRREMFSSGVDNVGAFWVLKTLADGRYVSLREKNIGLFENSVGPTGPDRCVSDKNGIWREDWATAFQWRFGQALDHQFAAFGRFLFLALFRFL